MKVIALNNGGDGYQEIGAVIRPSYIVTDDEGRPIKNLTSGELDRIVTEYFEPRKRKG